MSAEPGGSVEIGSMTITSTTTDADGILNDFHDGKPPEPDASEATAVLGKRGAEAAAEKRKAEAKEAKKQAKAAVAEDQVDPADPEAEPADEKGKEKKGNPRHDAHARVVQATQEAAEAKRTAETERRRAEAFERRLEELERGRRTPEQRQQPQAQPDGKPRQEDYENWGDFLDARDAYAEKQREAKQAQERQVYEDRQAEREYIQPYLKSISEYAKAQGQDWKQFFDGISEEVREIKPTFKGGPPNGSTWIADYLIANAEQAPALMLHFTEHSDEFQRIAALSSPWHTSRELAKLETSLGVATTAPNPKPTVSKAPPPVRPVTGAPVTDSKDLTDDAPLSAFIASHGQRELSSRR